MPIIHASLGRVAEDIDILREMNYVQVFSRGIVLFKSAVFLGCRRDDPRPDVYACVAIKYSLLLDIS